MSVIAPSNQLLRVIPPVTTTRLSSYRLQSPAKLARGLAIVAFVFGSLFVGLGSANAGIESAPLQSVVVSQGSSLWQLAQMYAPESQPEEWVAKLVDINKLTSSILTPGQRLLLPAG